MYPGPTPAEGWRYQLDDYGVSYGDGLWPFYRAAPDPVQVGTGRRARYEYPLAPGGIRLSPDSEFCGWADWYVGILPPRQPEGTIARAWTSLRVRRQGLGAIIVPAKISIDLAQDGATIDDRCPEPLRELAELKAARILESIRQHRAARDGGAAEPVTAHHVYLQRQQQ